MKLYLFLRFNILFEMFESFNSSLFAVAERDLAFGIYGLVELYGQI